MTSIQCLISNKFNLCKVYNTNEATDIFQKNGNDLDCYRLLLKQESTIVGQTRSSEKYLLLHLYCKLIISIEFITYKTLAYEYRLRNCPGWYGLESYHLSFHIYIHQYTNTKHVSNHGTTAIAEKRQRYSGYWHNSCSHTDIYQ
jgi:hypothetical protein